jgi:hypothetical protein
MLEFLYVTFKDLEYMLWTNIARKNRPRWLWRWAQVDIFSSSDRLGPRIYFRCGWSAQNVQASLHVASGRVKTVF